jgi:hypothetical protein
VYLKLYREMIKKCRVTDYSILLDVCFKPNLVAPETIEPI